MTSICLSQCSKFWEDSWYDGGNSRVWSKHFGDLEFWRISISCHCQMKELDLLN